MKQAFGAGTWNWSTAGLAPGAYTVHVWANQTGDPTAAWEAYGSSVVTLTGCATAALSPSGSSPVGTTIVFTGSSTGCPTPVYEFWLQDTGGAWHMEQAFALGKTWSWDSTGWARGVYHIHVWANQQGADTSSWEAYGAATYTLT